MDTEEWQLNATPRRRGVGTWVLCIGGEYDTEREAYEAWVHIRNEIIRLGIIKRLEVER